jgi:serine/threonine protein kinase
MAWASNLKRALSSQAASTYAREVSHFNVCKVYDLHSVSTPEGDVEFLSMEFIQGETLSARLRNRGPLTPKEAHSIARQICAGVTQAHKQDVIHGDLKTGNVLLSELPDGAVRAVVSDFGLARFDRSGGQGGTRPLPPRETAFLAWGRYIAPPPFSKGAVSRQCCAPNRALESRPPWWRSRRPAEKSCPPHKT